VSSIFDNIFDSAASTIGSIEFVECVLCGLVLGAIISLVYGYKSRHTDSFALTIALLPAMVCVVIMMIDDSIGTGIAVAGAFSLVKFRSVPGTAKEIAVIFLAMAVGLIIGMGYLGYAALFTAIICLILVAATLLRISYPRRGSGEKVLKITMPEDMDYTSALEDVFSKYTSSHELKSAKTINMGSMYRLTYSVVLNDERQQKQMIDEFRVRNGNLEIALGLEDTDNGGL
jgi:hypothetical protein